MLLRHTLRNSAGAALSMGGLQVGLMFAGVMVVEVVYNWPGIGLYTYQSINRADFPAIAGVTVLLGAVYVVDQHDRRHPAGGRRSSHRAVAQPRRSSRASVANPIARLRPVGHRAEGDRLGPSRARVLPHAGAPSGAGRDDEPAWSPTRTARPCACVAITVIAVRRRSSRRHRSSYGAVVPSTPGPRSSMTSPST